LIVVDAVRGKKEKKKRGKRTEERSFSPFFTHEGEESKKGTKKGRPAC